MFILICCHTFTDLSEHATMEDVQYEDILLQMPSEVSWDFEILAEIISPDTWNNFLDDDNREQLMVSAFLLFYLSKNIIYISKYLKGKVYLALLTLAVPR